MNLAVTLSVGDFAVMFIVMVGAFLSGAAIIRWMDSREKIKMMAAFFGNIQEKIETEGEFQRIIDHMKDDGGQDGRDK